MCQILQIKSNKDSSVRSWSFSTYPLSTPDPMHIQIHTYVHINQSHSTATSPAHLKGSSAWRVNLTTNCHFAVTFSWIYMCINLTVFEVGSQASGSTTATPTAYTAFQVLSGRAFYLVLSLYKGLNQMGIKSRKALEGFSLILQVYRIRLKL